IYVEGGRFVVESEAGSGGVSSSSKCSLVFYHRDHKERREVADLRLICRFFVFSVLLYDMGETRNDTNRAMSLTPQRDHGR
ncbi:MAG: hypothetical protein WBF31_14205, partial [Anaerolineae bacterium]